MFERERRELFAHSWVPVCTIAQVANPGDFVATSIAGEPVIVLRGDDGELRALSNVCRHRASLLVREAGNCPRVLRCPYHGWTYGHDGQLVGVPEARGFDDLDRDAVALPQFSLGVMADLVCVNLDPDAEPLSGWFGELETRLEAFGLGRLTVQGPYIDEYDHNWKVIADNYLEGYHIPVGHPGLLRMLDYKRYRPTPGRHHSWIDGPLREGSRSKDKLERLYQRAYEPMPGFPGARELVDVRAHVPVHVHRHLSRSDRHLAAATYRACGAPARSPGSSRPRAARCAPRRRARPTGRSTRR